MTFLSPEHIESLDVYKLKVLSFFQHDCFGRKDGNIIYAMIEINPHQEKDDYLDSDLKIITFQLYSSLFSDNITAHTVSSIPRSAVATVGILHPSQKRYLCRVVAVLMSEVSF